MATPPRRRATSTVPTPAGTRCVRHKPFVLDWMAEVARRARRLEKRLLPFSHYPALDTLGETHADEVALFGLTGLARRAPGPAIARAVARTAIGVHFSGHLHVNATTLLARR